MADRLTPEQEAKLRKDSYYSHGVPGALLAEINALREQIQVVEAQRGGYQHGYESFKARAFRLESENSELTSQLVALQANAAALKYEKTEEMSIGNEVFRMPLPPGYSEWCEALMKDERDTLQAQLNMQKEEYEKLLKSYQELKLCYLLVSNELEQKANSCSHPGCCCVCGHTGRCPEDGASAIGGVV